MKYLIYCGNCWLKGVKPMPRLVWATRFFIDKFSIHKKGWWRP